MDGNDVVRDDTRAVRRRPRRPKSKAYKGVTYLLTTLISSHPVPVFVSAQNIDGENVGLFDPVTHEIAVTLPGQSPPAEADRVLHEHLHAISTLLMPPEIRLTEPQVTVLSTALVDMLIRNEPIREFLLERLVHSEHLESKKHHRSKPDKRSASDSKSAPDTQGVAS